MASSSKSQDVALFDDFELDLVSGDLRRNGSPIKLQPQPGRVLTLLVGRAGQVVSRNEIAEQVWGTDTFVDFDQGLNFAIRQIRTALGDDADQPRFLETLPKRGYRFIAPLRETGSELVSAPSQESIPQSSFGPSRYSSRRWVAALTAAFVLLVGVGYFTWHRFQRVIPQRPIVLAVLPFDDLTGNAQDYLVDGLTEEMIARLTGVSPEHLHVIARTSAMQYRHTQKSARQIGQELGADYILENSIRHEGDRLRITAQLVRTADQTHLWAQNYDREMHELLAIESNVTADIAEQIHLQLLPPSVVRAPANLPLVDATAHELYLKGRYSFNQRSRESLRQSVEYFRQATDKDPGYAAAYAGQADAYNLIAFYGFDPTLNAVTQAKIAADKALRLDNSMAAAHAARAYTEFMWREDWQTAEQEFQRALQLDDNYVPAHQWYALYLAARGRIDDSLGQMHYAQREDPLSPAVRAGLGYIYYFARDYDQAIEHSRVALELNPNFMAAHAVIGWAEIQQEKYPEAIDELQTAVKLSGGVPVYLCGLGRAYALSGNLQGARAILAQVEATAAEPNGSGTALAALYVSLGDSDHALRWLEMTAPGDLQANWLRVDPAFDPLRQNPRFAAIVSRIGAKKE